MTGLVAVTFLAALAAICAIFSFTLPVSALLKWAAGLTLFGVFWAGC